EALTGAGAKAWIDGTEVYVGSASLFEHLGSRLGGAEALAEEYFEEGKTVVLVGTAERVLGLVALRDQSRPEAPQAIGALHAVGIGKVAMLTGDNHRTGRAIARGLGIDEVKAELKPEDKSVAIRELEESFGPAAMVGDGINDAPALATATVGIAMGTAGTDAAIEAADVALMGDDIEKVAYTIELGKRARSISRQNIGFSFLLLAALIPSALIGIMTITIAVAVHEVGELLAIGNGLRVAKR